MDAEILESASRRALGGLQGYTKLSCCGVKESRLLNFRGVIKFYIQEANYERGEILEELSTLRETVLDRDAEVENLKQDLCEFTERLPVSLPSPESTPSPAGIMDLLCHI